MPDSEEAYGCLSFVILFILFWALIFGVTIDGRYYAIKCSSDRGIEFKNVELEDDGEK